jgi:hypothetical protein
VIQITKRLQSTVEHSNIILKQVQAKFPMPGENASNDKAAEAGAANARRESVSTQVGPISIVLNAKNGLYSVADFHVGVLTVG